MRRLLADHRLAGPERALVLCYLTETALLRDTGASATDIDVWSKEALELCDTPTLRLTRAGALAQGGRDGAAEAAGGAMRGRLTPG